VNAVSLLRAHPGCSRRLQARFYLFAVIQLALWGQTGVAAAQAVAEVQVTPETMTLGVGQKQPLFATAFDQRGNLISSAKFTFWSSDTLIAQVRKDGTVIGVKPGLAKIEARVQGKRASMAVLITGGAPADPSSRSASATVLTIDPASVSLFPGESTRVAAQGLREDGSPASLGRVTIRSLKPEIAKVDTGGLIIGVAPGRTIVQAASGRLMATLPVEVAQVEFAVVPARLSLAPEEVDTIRALVPSQGNREIRGLVQWRSSDTAVATVNASGVVRARAPGQVDIIGLAFGQERRTAVAVHRVPDAMVVSPPHTNTVVVPLRSMRQFTAVAESADSSPIAEARINWQVGDPEIAAFDPATGILTAKSVGTTTLTAKLPGITPAVWTIQVTSGDVAVEPARAGLLVAQRTTLSAISRESGASVAKSTGAKWTSDHPEVAEVRENGVVEALSPGHAVISAAMPWGKRANADVYVVGDLTISSNRSGLPGIYQMRVPGPATLIPVLVDNASNVQAVLGPDRTRVCFSSNRNGSFDLYLVDPDGQNLRRLTSVPGNEGEPTWTPDGTRIIYTATSGTNTQIASMAMDGTDNRQLTTASGGNHSPSVSPDGRSIAFVSAREGNHAIYTMNLDGSNQRRLTKGSARETSPRFGRNGELYYVVERGGSSKGSKVLRVGTDGNTTQVLQTEEPIASLAVSRDGERLIYVVSRGREAARSRPESTLYLQSLATRAPPTSIPLQPGEQVLNPSF
jgi:uncharacterized protein YjdB